MWQQDLASTISSRLISATSKLPQGTSCQGVTSCLPIPCVHSQPRKQQCFWQDKTCMCTWVRQGSMHEVCSHASQENYTCLYYYCYWCFKGALKVYDQWQGSLKIRGGLEKKCGPKGSPPYKLFGYCLWVILLLFFLFFHFSLLIFFFLRIFFGCPPHLNIFVEMCSPLLPPMSMIVTN